MQSLGDVALFVEVARTGSFRLASARLGIPPSTLSRRIAAMEGRLGARLFLRTTRSVALTSVAKPYFDRCLEVLEAAERAQNALSAGHGRQMQMRIAMPVDLGVEMLGPSIASFADSHPGLQVEFELSSRAVDLLRDPVDLAFRIGRPLDHRVVARKIASIASGIFAAPDLLRRLTPVTGVEQLASLPCLDLRTAQGSMPWTIGARHWTAAPGPCVLRANSVALLRRFAEDGRGIALLPVHVARQAVHRGQLIRLLPDEATPTWPVFAVTVDRTVPALVRQLINHVRRDLA